MGKVQNLEPLISTFLIFQPIYWFGFVHTAWMFVVQLVYAGIHSNFDEALLEQINRHTIGSGGFHAPPPPSERDDICAANPSAPVRRENRMRSKRNGKIECGRSFIFLHLPGRTQKIFLRARFYSKKGSGVFCWFVVQSKH